MNAADLDDEERWAVRLATAPVNGKASAPAPPTATVVRMDQVQAERIKWLWLNRLPLGKLSVLDGNPGLGKSTLSMHIAAAVTRGWPVSPGDAPAPVGGVVLLSAEDGLGDTLRPRLEEAGADLTKIVALVEVPDGDGKMRPPELPADVDFIEKAAMDVGAKLVIVDPIMAYLGADTDAHRDQDIRRALLPLAMLAERTGAAVLIVRHLRKSAGASAIHAGGGSIGIIGAARAGLLVARDPDDPAVRVLAQTKSNLGPESPSLRYRLVSTLAEGAAHIEWVAGDCEHRADDLVAADHQFAAKGDEDNTAIAEACEVLRTILAGKGEVLVKELGAAAQAHGISAKTLKRARAKVGVQTARRAVEGQGATGPWVCWTGERWPPGDPGPCGASGGGVSEEGLGGIQRLGPGGPGGPEAPGGHGPSAGEALALWPHGGSAGADVGEGGGL